MNITDLDWQLVKEKYKDNLEEVLKKLEEHYPIQYLIGYVEFYDTIINVDERVLIPRFETEFLVEKTIQKIKDLKLENPTILELGTGSGCISIALKKHISCEITALDISQNAIDLAKKNARNNNVDIHFKTEDMLKASYEQYDVIISNPPYIANDIKVAEETKYEPKNAIFAPSFGMYFYEEILKKIAQLQTKPKLIAFEIGYEQKEKIEKLITTYLSTYHAITEKDLNGKDRYTFLIHE